MAWNGHGVSAVVQPSRRRRASTATRTRCRAVSAEHRKSGRADTLEIVSHTREVASHADA
eukprot:6208291-Pleurochrysis_carterae.AAC.1